MIITKIWAGLGNQLFQYAVGRQLAAKHNTELKLDIRYYRGAWPPYRLDRFNITAPIATPDDIKRVSDVRSERWPIRFQDDIYNAPDNVYLNGLWQSNRYFAGIEDILRKEFTIRPEFLSDAVKPWLDKINSAECAVSVHLRHGDYMEWRWINGLGIPSLEYYSDCIKELRKYNDCITLFVFSDHIAWAREYLHFGFPTEFVDDCESEIEELFLMSQCRHNIIPNSTFGFWGAWLNAHLGKKVFAPKHWMEYKDLMLSKNTLGSETWIPIVVDREKIPPINAPIGASIIIHVDSDLEAAKRTLALLPEKRNWRFEFILVGDNAGGDVVNLCNKKAADRSDIRFFQTYKKIGRAAAYNIGLNAARGMFVNFISSGDQIDLKQFFDLVQQATRGQMLHSVRHSVEASDRGGGAVNFNGLHYALRADENFQALNTTTISAMTAPQRAEALAARNMSTALGANFFSREWLIGNHIRFKENLGVRAEIIFLLDCLLKISTLVLTPANFFFTNAQPEPVIMDYEHDHGVFLSELIELAGLMDLIAVPEDRKRVERLFVENFWFKV